MNVEEKIWSNKRSQTSLNPQGLSADERHTELKSQLEQRAKKKNTKI